MAYIFADEAGNFDFTPRGTAYFIVTAVLMWDWSQIAGEILKLRHELAKEGAEPLAGLLPHIPVCRLPTIVAGRFSGNMKSRTADRLILSSQNFEVALSYSSVEISNTTEE